jgi:hypothetical protein
LLRGRCDRLGERLLVSRETESRHHEGGQLNE